MLVFQGVHQSSLKRLLFHAQSMNALPGYIIMGLLVENAGQPRRDDRLSFPLLSVTLSVSLVTLVYI